MNATLIHAAISAAAIYVPAYVLKASLMTTIIVWSVAEVISSFVVKNVPSGGVGTTEMVLLSIVPVALLGYKFGFQGVLAYVVVSVISTLVVLGLAKA